MFTASKFHDQREYDYCSYFRIKELFYCNHVVFEIWYPKIYDSIEDVYNAIRNQDIPLYEKLGMELSRNESKALKYMGFNRELDTYWLYEAWKRLYGWTMKIKI
jgi:hypothetical protein